jgi:hypothetical protein
LSIKEFQAERSGALSVAFVGGVFAAKEELPLEIADIHTAITKCVS